MSVCWSVGASSRRAAQSDAADPLGLVPGTRFLQSSAAAATAGSLLGKTGNDSTSPLSVQSRQRGTTCGSPPPPPSSIRTLLCLLAHFLPGRRFQRLPGGGQGTDPGALRADDKVKESLRPLGTLYLSWVFNPPHIPSGYHPFSFKASLQSSHYTTSGIVLSCLSP